MNDIHFFLLASLVLVSPSLPPRVRYLLTLFMLVVAIIAHAAERLNV